MMNSFIHLKPLYHLIMNVIIKANILRYSEEKKIIIAKK